MRRTFSKNRDKRLSAILQSSVLHTLLNRQTSIASCVGVLKLRSSVVSEAKHSRLLTCLVAGQHCSRAWVDDHAELDVLLVKQIAQAPAQETNDRQKIEVVGAQVQLVVLPLTCGEKSRNNKFRFTQRG